MSPCKGGQIWKTRFGRTEIDDQRRHAKHMDQDIMCIIVSVFLFSNHLIISDLMALLNTIMLYIYF